MSLLPGGLNPPPPGEKERRKEENKKTPKLNPNKHDRLENKQTTNPRSNSAYIHDKPSGRPIRSLYDPWRPRRPVTLVIVYLRQTKALTGQQFDSKGQKMNTYAISDIHGAYLALEEALDLANFQNDEDTLIFTGDVCDGWPDVVESINLLKSIKNFVFVRGNHDQWALDWLTNNLTMSEQLSWVDQSGDTTIASVVKHNAEDMVMEFLKTSKPYHVLGDMVFVHGGLVPGENIEDSDPEDLMWDRFMVQNAFYTLKGPETPYSTIFCGHTPTLSINGSTKPMHLGNIWNLDTGASYDGPLTIMNVETFEYWQTEPVGYYYPGVRAR